MKGILRYLGAAAVFLLLAGAGAAHAQSWPTTINTMRCNWTLPSGGSVIGGTSMIRFSLGPVTGGGLIRTGTLTTTYPTGSVVTKNITLIWDYMASHPDTFTFQQTSDVPNIDCNPMRTFDSGSLVIFDGCTNGAVQYCRWP
jgi:hypothetical protein